VKKNQLLSLPAWLAAVPFMLGLAVMGPVWADEQLVLPEPVVADLDLTPAEVVVPPLSQAEIERLIDQRVEARLQAMPRPRYVPATDILPPQGAILIETDADRGEFPFSAALSGFVQLRWLEFARSSTNWTDSTGQNFPVTNINTFNLNRFFITTAGHVVDERLLYNITIFGTTDNGLRAPIVPIGFGGFKWSEAAMLAVGMTQVFVTREWPEAPAWQMGVERSMANTFFRPGFSPGVFAKGSLGDRTLFYQAGIWNGIDGGTLGTLRQGTSMAFAGTSWWEPLAPFGLGYGDMSYHRDPAVRLGLGGCYGRTQELRIVGGNPEDTLIRLSDGTPLNRPGALGDGTQIDQFRYHLASVDAGWKYRGWAVNFEYYFRLLNNFIGDGPFERNSVYDQGGNGYVSWCFLPRTLEAYGRSSVVTGDYGTGQEYGGGINWYLKKSRQARLTLEALSILRSPAQNPLYPYRAGFSGTAIQTQLMVIF
jgi:hypothetical protein